MNTINSSSTETSPLSRTNTAGITERSVVTVPISSTQSEKIQKLSQAPGYLVADANGSKDLAEYGDKFSLNFSRTDDGEIIFLETQKSADDKFTHYLRNTSEEDLLHGDRFLKELLQADITELEPKQRLLSSLMVKKENVLPLLALSKKDSTGQLSHEDELRYKSLLSEFYRVEIENYLTKGPHDRDADDYVERIRRILRTNARKIDKDSLPRNLSGAWESEAQRNCDMTRKQIITTTGLTATALLSAILALFYSDSNGKVTELNRDIEIKIDLIKEQSKKLVGKSITDSDFYSNKSVSLDILLNRLESADKSKMIFLAKEILEQAKINYKFNDQIQILYSIPQPEILNENRRTNIEARYSEKHNLLHIVIPKPLLETISKNWDPELGPDNARIQVKEYLKL